MIVLHLKLSHTNTYSDDLPARLTEYLDLAIRRVEGKTQLIDIETVVVLFYNCLKVIVGLNEIESPILYSLDKLYAIFRMKNPGKLYSWHVLQFFFVIKIVIFEENIQNPVKNKKDMK